MDEVVAHDGRRYPCVAIPRLVDLSREILSSSDVIAIDEAQFFPDLFEFTTRAADEGVEVVVAGLDGDFKREPFGDILRLIPHADEVTKLRSECAICGTPAPFTARKVSSTDQTLVGGAESYLPVCREHYIEVMKANFEAVE